MNKYFWVLFACFLYFSTEVCAQFILSGEFRPRTELSRGYKNLATSNQKMSIATAQRTRLNALYSPENLNTKLVLQDVRYWGSQPQLVANEDFSASIHEAWAEISLFTNFSIRAGRQELIYDDHRIFGNVGWAHQARSHDLALLKYEKTVKLHFGVAHNENSDITNNLYLGPDAYKNMQFAWFNTSWENSILSLLALNNGVPVLLSAENEISRYSQTIGGRFVYMLNEISFAANLYGQTGEHRSGNKISALNFLAEISLKKGLTAGYEYLSGNSYDKTDKVYAFEPYYGTNHKFNGYMDYFYVGNHINSIGLHDIYLKFNHSIDKIRFDTDLHYFASPGKISPDAKNYLGTELDLGISWSLQPMATLGAGWSVMFAGESLELLRGGNHTAGQHWGYVMLTATPVFIK